MHRVKSCGAFLLAFILLWGGHSVASAAAPSLLRYVGSDAGLCIEAANLQKHLPQLAQSPLAERFRQTEFFSKLLQSRPYLQFVQGRAAVESLTGKPLPELTRELFGHSLVIAVYPVAEGQPAGVLLTRTESPTALAEALAAWHRADKSEVIEHAYAGVSYHQKVKPGAAGSRNRGEFYVVFDDALAISDNESAIERVIDLAAQHGDLSTESLENAPAFLKARQAVSTDAAVWVYFNPRAWKGVTEDLPADDPFAGIWNRCESVMAALNLNDGVALDVTLQYDGRDVPFAWSQFVESAQGTPGFFKSMPAEALAVVAGRCSVIGLDDLIEPHLSERERREWSTARQVLRGLLAGLDLFDDVLLRLGPNWGGYLLARDDAPQGFPPFHGLFTVELSAEDRSDGSTPQELTALPDALQNALLTGMNLLAAVRNGKGPERTAVVQTGQLEGAFVAHIVDYGPLEPTFAVSQDRLVLATQRAMLQSFLEREQAIRAGGTSAESVWSRHIPEGTNKCLLLRPSALGKLLASSEDFWPFSRDNSKARDRARELLGLGDVAVVAVGVDESSLRLVLSWTIDSPEPVSP